MGLKIKFDRPAEPSKVTEPKEESIFDALNKFQDGKMGTLMLVHRHTGDSHRVLGYDKRTGKARLKTSTGMELNPMLTDREAAIYRPMWR